MHIAVHHGISDDNGASAVLVTEPRRGVQGNHVVILRQDLGAWINRRVNLVKSHAATFNVFGSYVAFIKLAAFTGVVEAPGVITQTEEGIFSSAKRFQNSMYPAGT